MLNTVVFGCTAKEWREANPELAKSGNIRDHAGAEELVVLANMESINAMLITAGVPEYNRYDRLRGEAERQMKVLLSRALLKDKQKRIDS